MLDNCPHSGDGWCLVCVGEEVGRLRRALLRIEAGCKEALGHDDPLRVPTAHEVLIRHIGLTAREAL